jgi:hypothetical protein
MPVEMRCIPVTETTPSDGLAADPDRNSIGLPAEEPQVACASEYWGALARVESVHISLIFTMYEWWGCNPANMHSFPAVRGKLLDAQLEAGRYTVPGMEMSKYSTIQREKEEPASTQPIELGTHLTSINVEETLVSPKNISGGEARPDKVWAVIVVTKMPDLNGAAISSSVIHTSRT